MLKDYNNYIQEIECGFTQNMSMIIKSFENSKDLDTAELSIAWEKCKDELRCLMFKTLQSILVLENINLDDKNDSAKFGSIVSIFSKQIEDIINKHYTNTIKPILTKNF